MAKGAKKCLINFGESSDRHLPNYRNYLFKNNDTNKGFSCYILIMSVVVSTSEIKLTQTESGVLRIGDSRVSLDTVITAFAQGATPEQIVEDYDSLELAEVYAAISYYLQNREEVENYLARRKVQRDQLRRQKESRSNPQGIRERLLARRRNLTPVA